MPRARWSAMCTALIFRSIRRTKSAFVPAAGDVVHGKVEYLEVVGFSDHRITAEIWYRLFNLGYRVAAGAGTDAMANYASLRGPVGLVRVFLETGGGSHTRRDA